jgi:hypothetical protein
MPKETARLVAANAILRKSPIAWNLKRTHQLVLPMIWQVRRRP